VSYVYVEAMNVASPHSAITSAHCLVGVGYTDTINTKTYRETLYFLDYLRVMIEDAGDDPLTLMRVHKKQIEENIASGKSKDKYEWLAKYHNDTIDKFCPVAKSEKITLGKA